MKPGTLIRRLRSWAREIKRDVVALWLAARDPRVPLLTKLLAACIAGYALSPIDLIPDFIPVLGYLDDVILVPLGIALVVRTIPPEVMADLRERATIAVRPRSMAGLIAVFTIWIASALMIVWTFCPSIWA